MKLFVTLLIGVPIGAAVGYAIGSVYGPFSLILSPIVGIMIGSSCFEFVARHVR